MKVLFSLVLLLALAAASTNALSPASHVDRIALATASPAAQPQESPEATVEPDETPSPEPSESPEDNESPEPMDTEEPTEPPEPAESAMPAASPSAGPAALRGL